MFVPAARRKETVAVVDEQSQPSETVLGAKVSVPVAGLEATLPAPVLDPEVTVDPEAEATEEETPAFLSDRVGKRLRYAAKHVCDVHSGA